MRAAALIALLILGACAPARAPPPHALALDCNQPFATLAARLVAQPGLVVAPPDSGEPYSFYSTADGSASYVVTHNGAAAHPAIIRQQAFGGAVKTTGCAYGDRKGYDDLLAYLDSLKTWTRR